MLCARDSRSSRRRWRTASYRPEKPTNTSRPDQGHERADIEKADSVNGIDHKDEAPYDGTNQ